ncbi:hypothetical protein ACJA27_00895 [Mycoplasmopsis lipophila]|uniref:hypothetical protein n=1 Tax=Mycoplasmopsis lipophila TaxID=2117 RepID=UPI003872F8F3
MIEIDWKETLDKRSIIIIKNLEDSKNKNKIEIDVDEPENWNKQNINAFLIRAVSIAEDKLSELQLTESAQNEIEINGNMQLAFIFNLFNEFIRRYNETL